MNIFDTKIWLPTGRLWLMPLILATWETEIRKIEVWGQPGQIVHEAPPQNNQNKWTAGVAQTVECPWVQIPIPLKRKYYCISLSESKKAVKCHLQHDFIVVKTKWSEAIPCLFCTVRVWAQKDAYVSSSTLINSELIACKVVTGAHGEITWCRIPPPLESSENHRGLQRLLGHLRTSSATPVNSLLLPSSKLGLWQPALTGKISCVIGGGDGGGQYKKKTSGSLV
jgi:hypothetical protein